MWLKSQPTGVLHIRRMRWWSCCRFHTCWLQENETLHCRTGLALECPWNWRRPTWYHEVIRTPPLKTGAKPCHTMLFGYWIIYKVLVASLASFEPFITSLVQIRAPNLRCFDNTLEKHDLGGLLYFFWYFEGNLKYHPNIHEIIHIIQFIPVYCKTDDRNIISYADGPCHLVIQACWWPRARLPKIRIPRHGSQIHPRHRMQWSYQNMPWISI